MTRYTVGSVPYVNAIPLTFDLEGVDVRYEVPSSLPPLLQSGEAQAILVSSVDALRVPDRTMVDGVCIGSNGPVKSVRLFSRVPFASIRTLAWDASSMTSNRLAMVLLAELHGVRPEVVVAPPDLAAMLNRADACVLIGDIGMTASGDGLHVMDLGEAWTAHTGRPFLWAGWIGTLDLPLALGDRLRRAKECAIGSHREPVIARAVATSGWAEATVRDYYENVMTYTLDAPMRAGFGEFARLLREHGFDDCRNFPKFV
jgi:chorismate dehydratase